MTTATTRGPNLLARQLTDAFNRAKAAGESAGQNDEDGGTCNLDCPAFRLKGAREVVIREAAELAGVTITPFTWFSGQRWFWLGGTFLVGQGNRRSRISHAATKSLRVAAEQIPGLEVAEYCQSD